MKTVLVIFVLTVVCLPLSAQMNMLGNSYGHIFGRFNDDPEFVVRIDTLENNSNMLMLTCKPSTGYPYYKYEIDRINDECVTFMTVSMDTGVLDTYVELLSVLGTLESEDSLQLKSVYKVAAPKMGTLSYSVIRQIDPARKNLFIILVSREKE